MFTTNWAGLDTISEQKIIAWKYKKIKFYIALTIPNYLTGR